MADRQIYPDPDTQSNYVPSRLERDPVHPRRDHLTPTNRSQPRGSDWGALPDWLREERQTATATTSEPHCFRRKSISPCFTAMEMWCMSEPKVTSFLSLPGDLADSAAYKYSDLDTRVDVTQPDKHKQRSPCFDSREMWILSEMCNPSLNGGADFNEFTPVADKESSKAFLKPKRACLELYDDDEIVVTSPSFEKKTAPLSDELSYSPTYIDHN